VRLEEVGFFSAGHRLAGTLKMPRDASSERGPLPAIVHGPGWLGLRDAKLYVRYHEALVAAGFAVLAFDYRGFGDSEGDGRHLDPARQVEDIHNAVTYLETRDELDRGRVGAFGSGATGGGNVVIAAGVDERIRAIVSQVPIADGREWLRRMRRESEWLDFVNRLEADRRQRVQTGSSELVDPREEIMVATPERRATAVKSDVDRRVPTSVELASADAILAYRPIDYVSRIAPRAAMFICVERDATTPEDHAIALYERASAPKKLVVQTGTTHYAAYEQYAYLVVPMIVDWFARHLAGGVLRTRDSAAESSVVYVHREPSA
jgi:fermentation-respiration switch protein FrsA (DUF1100 family)